VIVVDASVVLEALVGQAREPALRERLAAVDDMVAPSFLDVEVANVLRREVRLGNLSPARGLEAIEDLVDLNLATYDVDYLLFRIWDFRHNLSAYDAAYVALAEDLRIPLLTRNRKLASIEGHSAQIILV
jgi:predicted nucleic acid-binding protein